ncbi:hypothetical protein LEMLEM_LOCUS25454 [Lemmus lemmus]
MHSASRISPHVSASIGHMNPSGRFTGERMLLYLPRSHACFTLLFSSCGQAVGLP